MPPTAQRVDPYANFNFLVEIDGIITAAFQEVSGLDSTIDIIENREGGPLTPYKYPGLTHYSNIVLKRGLTEDRRLYDWHQEVADGTVKRTNGSIIGLDRAGHEVSRWEFYNAWPCKYVAPTFNSEAADIAVETLELAHERLVRTK